MVRRLPRPKKTPSVAERLAKILIISRRLQSADNIQIILPLIHYRVNHNCFCPFINLVKDKIFL